MRFVHIDNLALHYRATGLDQGKPLIVFVNSLGTDWRIWAEVIDGLKEEFAILAYDKRGHGLSDLGPVPYAMADHAADLAGLMDHLGLSGALVCGVSVGGQIAQQLYHDRPDLVAGLVLSNTAAQIGNPEFWAQRIERIREDGIEAVAEGIIERWFAPDFRRPDNAAHAGYRNMLIRQPVEGYLATCAAIRDFDRRADAARIAVPVACIGGEADGATPPELVEEFARSIPGAEYVLIRGAGHLPCVERPIRVVEIIRGLAQRIWGDKTDA